MTSRMNLAVRGERQFPVQPLDVTEVGWAPASDSAAVRLFVARTQAVDLDFALTAENAPTIVAICARLDGLPLAIELAAARMPVLGHETLLARLEQRLPLLSGGMRDLPRRQRTMRDAIAWSYDLLSPDMQCLFRHLSVFTGGFTLEGAAALAPSETAEGDVLDGLSTLIGASLLRREDYPGGPPRFAMLETIREFGLEMLATRGEEHALRQRHASYYQGLAERAHDAALRGAYLTPLVDDLANLRSALGWLEQTGEAEQTLQLAGALWPIWYVRGPYQEGRAWVERALRQGDRADTAVWGRALVTCGLLAIMQGDTARAEACFTEVVAIARGGNFALAEATALLGLLWVAVRNEDLAHAEELGEAALALIWTTDDPQVAKVTASMILDNLGSVAFVQGDLRLATIRFTEALTHQREASHHWGEANSLLGLAYIARARGDDAVAREAFRAALPLFGAHEDARKIALALAGIAGLAVRHDATQAARLIGAAAALCQAGGLALDPEYRDIHERDEAATRAALGETAFTKAWSEGHRLSLDDASTLARTVLDAPRTMTQTASLATGHGLTPRELEVLRLLVEGRSDKEIGAALFISHRTAMNHVSRILAKLGVPTRAVAAREAVRQGLV